MSGIFSGVLLVTFRYSMFTNIFKNNIAAFLRSYSYSLGMRSTCIFVGSDSDSVTPGLENGL